MSNELAHIRFSTLNADSTESNVVVIPQSTIMDCPHCILVASHYNQDGSCKCSDPQALEMRKWGYRWNIRKGQWQ